MAAQPSLTHEAVAAFIQGYHYYSRTAPDPAVDAALQDMLVRAWPGLDPRSKQWLADLDRILHDPGAVPAAQREAANKHWQAVFGVVGGCIGYPDPNTRALRFQELMGYF